MKKRKAKSRAMWRRMAGKMAGRVDRRRRAEGTELEDLFALAAEPVRPGTGCMEHGAGRYCYVKGSWVDDSQRVWRFENREDVERAMAIGVAADEMRERGEELAS